MNDIDPKIAFNRVIMVGHGGPGDVGPFFTADLLAASSPERTFLGDQLAPRLSQDAEIWLRTCCAGQTVPPTSSPQLMEEMANLTNARVIGNDGEWRITPQGEDWVADPGAKMRPLNPPTTPPPTPPSRRSPKWRGK